MISIIALKKDVASMDSNSVIQLIVDGGDWINIHGDDRVDFDDIMTITKSKKKFVIPYDSISYYTIGERERLR